MADHDARTGRPLRVGAYVQGMQENAAAFADFEALVGRQLEVASYFYGFGDVFPGATELGFSDGGRRDVLLSWDMGATRFRQWARGRYDPYLRQIAAAAKAYPYPVYVRPWPEMNGDWQDFQPTRTGHRKHGGTYREFIAAWRHVVSYTRKHGARNIRWVFNPTADTYPQTTRVSRIWPGRKYVDVLGLDGYNWGDSGHGGWRSFRQIFHTQYHRLTRLDPHAPVWVCEFGSKEPLVDDGAPVDRGHSKASWLTDALSVPGMPRVEALVYFQADKERDWRVNSSQGALVAFQQGVARVG
ncbi:MAG TPA: glycosyl hydrolase [Nocardioides sp.]|uniref:glycoside hydrolase family 26 protein n=1 Tax=Nocardioides sp. TaxID=35761 RepID=UPI002E366008|nr:glycosyl hydrolase [Nocardioides sp.]HEX5088154.1 glycosyl hydrolase [Nocardioides sp.]